MADRYWVGGTAAWDGTAGTKWATTSGGAGGASVPTSADDVFFSVLSTGTCTISTGNTGAKSINCTGFTGTIAGSAAITVSGSITLSAVMNFSHTGTVTIDGTGTLTTAGKTFGVLTINGSGITVTLGDNLNIGTRNLTVTQGTFDTSASNFSITAGSITSSNTNVRTITLNGSTVTLSTVNVIAFTDSTNLTFNAGTSQINLTNTPPVIAGGGQTFYNVSFTATNITSPSITGANTFNNLTFAARTATGIGTVSLSADQTINGTLTVQSGATDPTRRLLIFSDTIGTARTITSAANTIFGADFRDITAAGAGSWTDSSRTNYWGDCKGNTGITCATGRSVYWNLVGAQNWSATGWATSSGGTPSAANFPLAQDTAVFDNTGSVTGIITVDNTWGIGSVDMSARTSTMTLTTIALYSVYGNWTNGSGTTLTGANTITFSGRTTQTITSVGKTFTTPISVDSLSGTVTLADNLTTSSAFTFLNGTLNLANNTLTSLTFNANVSTTRVVQFGTGNITVTGAGGGLFAFGGTNFTYTGTPTINISNNSAAAATVTVSSGFTQTNALNYNITTGTYSLTLNAARVGNLNLTGFAGTLLNNTRIIYGNLTIPASGTTLAAGTLVTTFAGTSGTQIITTNGKTLDFPVTINGVGGTVQLADDLTLGATRTLYVQAGTFDANNKNVTIGIFRSNGANTRSIIMGSGTWTISGTGVAWNIGTVPQGNITLNAGTSTIVFSDSEVGSKTFSGGGLTYNNLVIGGGAGTGVFNFTASNTFNTVSSTRTSAYNIYFIASTTTTFTNFNINGTAGNLVTISSDSASNHTLAKAGGGTVTADYLSISYSTATPTLTWLATNSTNGGNNSGWYFGAFPSTSSSGNYFLLF